MLTKGLKDTKMIYVLGALVNECNPYSASITCIIERVQASDGLFDANSATVIADTQTLI